MAKVFIFPHFTYFIIICYAKVLPRSGCLAGRRYCFATKLLRLRSRPIAMIEQMCAHLGLLHRAGRRWTSIGQLIRCNAERTAIRSNGAWCRWFGGRTLCSNLIEMLLAGDFVVVVNATTTRIDGRRTDSGAGVMIILEFFVLRCMGVESGHCKMMLCRSISRSMMVLRSKALRLMMLLSREHGKGWFLVDYSLRTTISCLVWWAMSLKA